MWKLRKYESKLFLENDYSKMKLIKEVEEEPDTDSILSIDGKFYRWAVVSPRTKTMVIDEIKLTDSPDEEYGDDFKCPYCGEIDQDAFELSDEDETECGFCGSEIKYTREVEITYSVVPVKRAPIIEL